MPILVDSATCPLREAGKYTRDSPPLQFGDSSSDGISLGLVNNMPDLALEGTERQFIKLLEAASEDICIHLRLYSLPGLPRTHWGHEYLSAGYFGIGNLRNDCLDALIVTGTEPRASNLRDEPYWSTLTEIIDWAEQNTLSTIWSCLAAHAAVLHMDGIDRMPLRDKCFGVFQFENASNHLIVRNAPERLRTPHSRWNGLQESALISRGYNILTNSGEVGVDAFVKQTRSMFIFFQGHPEYTEDTLMREYRRDVGRFLRGERLSYPNMPQGYLDKKGADILDAFRQRALTDRREQLLSTFPDALPALKVTNTWRSHATQLYRNWLLYLVAQKKGKVEWLSRSSR